MATEYKIEFPGRRGAYVSRSRYDALDYLIRESVLTGTEYSFRYISEMVVDLSNQMDRADKCTSTYGGLGNSSKITVSWGPVDTEDKKS